MRESVGMRQISPIVPIKEASQGGDELCDPEELDQGFVAMKSAKSCNSQ